MEKGTGKYSLIFRWVPVKVFKNIDYRYQVKENGNYHFKAVEYIHILDQKPFYKVEKGKGGKIRCFEPIYAVPSKNFVKKVSEHEIGHGTDFENLFVKYIVPMLERVQEHSGKSKAMVYTSKISAKDARRKCREMLRKKIAWKETIDKFEKACEAADDKRDSKQQVIVSKKPKYWGRSGDSTPYYEIYPNW